MANGLVLILFCIVQENAASQPSHSELQTAVIQSFQATHDGYSSDEVLLDELLNKAFISHCQKLAPTASSESMNWTLINLRKAGKLSHIKTTRRRNISTSEVLPIAEIAARSLLDQHQKSMDRLLCSPDTRQQFNQLVTKLSPRMDPYLARKAAFQLRKSRRLRPELITRIADWDRKVFRLTLDEIKSESNKVPARPGVYMFSDASGYLYIGQSENLRKRLGEHISESSNERLLEYLVAPNNSEVYIEIHAFPKDSRAKKTSVRRAYESELIRSRKPRFNILP